MKTKMEFNLIEGEFGQNEAKEILIQLFNDKINFHVRKSFSSNIRFGIKDENSEKRIKSLSAELKNINTFLSSQEAKDQDFRINATIELISIEKEQSNQNS